MWVPCSGDDANRVREQMMRGHGAEEVRVYGLRRPARDGASSRVWRGASVSARLLSDAQALAHAPRPTSQHRDMRHTVGLECRRRSCLQAPDSLSVPTTGREQWDISTPRRSAERARLDKTFVNPSRLSDSSDRARRAQVPAHVRAVPRSRTMKGDGPVDRQVHPAARPARSRARAAAPTASSMRYLRHGGAVMPNYSAQVTEQEAYDLINYLRHEQRTNPR